MASASCRPPRRRGVKITTSNFVFPLALVVLTVAIVFSPSFSQAQAPHNFRPYNNPIQNIFDSIFRTPQGESSLFKGG